MNDRGIVMISNKNLIVYFAHTACGRSLLYIYICNIKVRSSFEERYFYYFWLNLNLIHIEEVEVRLCVYANIIRRRVVCMYYIYYIPV